MDALERGSFRNVQAFVFMQDGRIFCAARGRFLEASLLKLVWGLLMVQHPRDLCARMVGPLGRSRFGDRGQRTLPVPTSL